MIKIILLAVLIQQGPQVEVQQCLRCHSEVWRDWKGSLHAQAHTDPIFLGVVQNLPQDQSTYCYSCHDPQSDQTGVSCTYCHRITEVLGGEETPKLRFAPRDTLYGPWTPTVDSLPHPVGLRKHFRQAAFCGACHDVRNFKGFLLFSTYTEWKNSPYAIEGLGCQQCHMPQDLLRSPVDKPYQSRLLLTAHGFQGGHSVEQLQRALDLVLFPVKATDPLEVRVDLTNKEAGHYLPTGVPNRWLRLQVDLLDGQGNLVARGERIYERVVGDEQGNRLVNIAEMFQKATQTLSDNRIPPRGTIHEKLVFSDIPLDRIKAVRARVYYEMGNLPEIRKGIVAKVLLASQTYPLERSTLGPVGKAVVFAFLLIALGLTLWFFLRKGGTT